MSKYVPNLLPEKPKFDFDERILSNYNWKKNISGQKVLKILSYIVGGLIMFASVGGLISRFWQGLFIFLIGFIILPKGQSIIEKYLKFTFSLWMKIIVISMLLFGAISINAHYENKEMIATKIKKENLEKEKQKAELEKQKEQERQDSLSSYSQAIVTYLSNKNVDKASVYIQEMPMYLKTKEDTLKYNLLRVDYLMQAKQFRDAKDLLTQFIDNDYNLSETYFKRAKCFIQLYSTKEAVEDLKHAISLGNEEANTLHNKINPINKKFVGYTTLCCDGTTSSNRGRGACSGHNGVCDWNHKVYQEYREY
ncbi:MAG: hypothetical protein J0H55_17015 [Chitinophagaceae bacterium]|nr:hypothetical protein [Chitinophagaceae bacterium]